MLRIYPEELGSFVTGDNFFYLLSCLRTNLEMLEKPFKRILESTENTMLGELMATECIT